MQTLTFQASQSNLVAFEGPFSDLSNSIAMLRLLPLFAVLLTVAARAENWTYTLELAGIPESSLQNFDIDWESPSQFRFGTMERNLRNQANLNFLHTGGGCQVFVPPRCTADPQGNCQITLQDKGYGMFTYFRRQVGVTRLQLVCSLPQSPPRSQEYEWADPSHQFLCVTDLFLPEERPYLAQLPFFGTLFQDDPIDRTDFLVLSATNDP